MLFLGCPSTSPADENTWLEDDDSTSDDHTTADDDDTTADDDDAFQPDPDEVWIGPPPGAGELAGTGATDFASSVGFLFGPGCARAVVR